MAKLHVFYSVMNAGKTTHLLQARHNYLETGGRVMLFTSAVDDRSRVGEISSRIGLSSEAVALREGDDLFALVAAEHARGCLAAVLMDEVQFMTVDQIHQAARVVDELGIPVMAYGLKNNAFGTLFSPAMATLLALADQLKEIKTLCFCHAKANMILRYGPDGTVEKSGNVVEIGGESRYVSVCRRHWMEGDIGPVRRAALGVAARQEAVPVDA